MVDVVLQGAWALYCISKGEVDESLLVLRRHVVNAIFLKYSKADRLSSSHFGIRNIPSDICCDEQNITRCNLNTSVLITPLNV